MKTFGELRLDLVDDAPISKGVRIKLSAMLIQPELIKKVIESEWGNADIVENPKFGQLGTAGS